jgi:putative drug exporter of the RND superfamily
MRAAFDARPGSRYKATMFLRLGQIVCGRPALVVAGWLVACVALGVVTPSEDAVRRNEPSTILPVTAPSNRAVELQREAFGQLASRSRVVVVLERETGLEDRDRGYVQALTQRLAAESRQQQGWRVKSPASQPFLKSRLESRDGRALMVIVDLDANFITRRAVDAVNRIEELLPQGRPEGLTCEITGTAAIGRDYARQTETALRRTTMVTIAAVLVILAFVYRAPLATIVPLLSIGISVYVSFCILGLLATQGWGFSNAEKIFIVVLVFGAGTDYALFWISRYREFLADGQAGAEAATSALERVGPAIVASSGTTIAGVVMLTAAGLTPYASAGRALGVALTISLVAAVTLAPALACVMRKALFWPVHPVPGSGVRISRRWTWISDLVVRRPKAVLFGGLACLVPPILATVNMEFRYDTLGELPEGSSSARGMLLAERHFSVGEIFSFDILIEWPGWPNARREAAGISRELAEVVRRTPQVADVWTLAQPFGELRAATTTLLGRLVTREAEDFYLSDRRPVMRAEVMLRDAPLSRASMKAAADLLRRVEVWAKDRLGPQAKVAAAGPTPYILDVAAISSADQKRIMPLVILVIWVVVMVLLRDAVLSTFMSLATLITYGATIGLTHLFFVYVLGEGGIDYKVNLFLFVLIVAVGQDYNIFLVTRLRQETAARGMTAGVRWAIIRTGSVISNCGLIMAATLGSLVVTDLDLLEQLGFALSLGVLIDTFVVRPLLVPSFCLLQPSLERRLRRRSANRVPV